MLAETIRADDNSYQQIGISDLIALYYSYLVEISIQRRTCELPGSSLAKEIELSFEAKLTPTGPTGFDTDDDSCFTGSRMEGLSDFRGSLNWGRSPSEKSLKDRRREGLAIGIKEGTVISLRL